MVRKEKKKEKVLVMLYLIYLYHVEGIGWKEPYAVWGWRCRQQTAAQSKMVIEVKAVESGLH